MADDVMAVDERLARLEVTVAKGFSEQSGCISSLEHKVDTLTGRVDTLDQKVDTLDQKVDTLDQKVDTLGRQVDALGRHVDTLGRQFDALERKVDGLNGKVDALNGKLDVVGESLEDKMQLVLERLDSRTNEMVAATQSMRREWRADRHLMYAMLKDHRIRIEALESTVRPGRLDPSTS
jgi:outer membrane murein-binding lipoprotein Lpp